MSSSMARNLTADRLDSILRSRGIDPKEEEATGSAEVETSAEATLEEEEEGTTGTLETRKLTFLRKIAT